MVSTWETCAQVALQGLEVDLSAPVLVKRSRWFCWFPSLIRQPHGTLWAVMSAYADAHVSSAFCYLSRSVDGGLTWDEPRVIGDAGLSHLILPDGGAVILPYYLRPRAGGAVGAPCNVLTPDGRLTLRLPGATVAGWPRPPKRISPDLDTVGFVFNGQVVTGQAGEYLATLYGTFEGDSRYSLVLAESSDGFAWHIRSIIAGPDCALAGEEGPCESALCRLADGRLLCLFRLASFVPYGRVVSQDDGRTWSAATSVEPGSVEPSLVVLGGGVLALSGGRSGIQVSFCADGRGEHWQSVDMVSHHNACQPHDPISPDSRPAWLPADEMIRRGLSGFTSSYTELARLDDRHGLLIYDRVGLGWNPIPDASLETNSVWVVRIGIKPR